MNTFFSNTFKNLRTPQRQKVTPFADKLSHLIFKVIFKYIKSLRIVALNNLSNGWTVKFSSVSVDNKKLNTGRATQNNEISVKILKQNADIFSDYICIFFPSFLQVKLNIQIFLNKLFNSKYSIQEWTK